MTHDHDFDRLADAWMADGPMDLADNVLFGALDEIHGTRQRRPLGMAWRPLMSNPPFRAATLVAVLVVAGLAAVGIARSLPAVGTTPTPVPSGLPVATAPAATEAPTPIESAPASTTSDVPMGFDGAGTIAFTRLDAEGDGLDRTWLVDPAGTNETPFTVAAGFSGATNLPGSGCCSVFAPDGRTVALGFDDTRPSSGTGTLAGTALVALDGTVVEQLPICGACVFLDDMNYVPVAWSAKGNHLALQAWNDVDPSKTGIYLVEAGTPRGSSVGWTGPITSGPRDMALALSPDGGRLLFIRPVDGGPDDAGALYVVDTMGGHGKETPLSAPGMLVYASRYFGPGASWSPDGTQVAYAATDTRGDNGAMQAWVVPATGGEAVAISGPAPFITSAHWSPDGRLIAYDAPGARSGHDLFVVAPDGSGVRNLTADFEPGVCCARWSPDSTALLTAGTLGPNERSLLYIVPVDGGEIRRVTSVEGFYEDFSWGPAAR